MIPGNENLLNRTEHEGAARAKRVAPLVFDGVSYFPLRGDENGQVIVIEGQVSGLWKTSKNTDFVVAASPFIFDLNNLLGENGREFFVLNDGPGDFDVAFSEDGIIFSDEQTLVDGDDIMGDGLIVNKVRITHTGTDSSFRINGR